MITTVIELFSRLMLKISTCMRMSMVQDVKMKDTEDTDTGICTYFRDGAEGALCSSVEADDGFIRLLVILSSVLSMNIALKSR